MDHLHIKLGRWLREESAAPSGIARADSFVAPVSFPRSVLFYLLLRRTRYLTAWGLAFIMAGVASYFAWYDFYKENRTDKNDGHRAIDFGGQYLMGRMLQQGYGKELYSRERQREVLAAEGAYHEDKELGDTETDVDHLMSATMGTDASTGERTALERWILEKVGEEEAIDPPHIGGPLYPPINAFISYPLAWLHPRTAYRINQGVNLLLAFLAALAATRLSQGRIWWPVASCFIFVFPGFAGSICLAQNATLTLNILLWGWLLMSRDRPLAGGIVWGMLAFKPVWLLSFLLVPLLTRRWRVVLAMLGTAAILALATLPFVGFHSWLDWLRIGHEAAVLYDTDENWTFMSRDLYSIPRRWLLDFTEANGERIAYPIWTRILSVGFLAAAIVVTVTVSCLRNKRIAMAKDGPAAAFVLLGAWMSCYHFMYYDVLLTALPVCLLFTDPHRYFEPVFLKFWPFGMSRPSAMVAEYYRPTRFFQQQSWLPYLTGGGHWLVNSLVMSLLALLISIQYVFPGLGIGVYKGPPSDTYVLIALWVWCGFRLLKEKNQAPATETESTCDVRDVTAKEEPLPPSEPWIDGWTPSPESAKTGIEAKPL